MADKQDKDRGRIASIGLNKGIIFNGKKIDRATMEIDHINHGLNKKTKKLNLKRRTNFTVNQIKEFILLLDGEDQLPEEDNGYKSVFSLRIDCPVKGRFFDKSFLIIFETLRKKENEIYIITLFPIWQRRQP